MPQWMSFFIRSILYHDKCPVFTESLPYFSCCSFSDFFCGLFVRSCWVELKYGNILAFRGRGFELWLLKVQKNWISSISGPTTCLVLPSDHLVKVGNPSVKQSHSQDTHLWPHLSCLAIPASCPQTEIPSDQHAARWAEHGSRDIQQTSSQMARTILEQQARRVIYLCHSGSSLSVWILEQCIEFCPP